ncbi:MAG: SLBB domain-containing protein, partial [Acidobacteriota bacterium]|nr:SLBB domain-containing protein [Acidobacteriota bacterium]
MISNFFRSWNCQPAIQKTFAISGVALILSTSASAQMPLDDSLESQIGQTKMLRKSQADTPTLSSDCQEGDRAEDNTACSQGMDEQNAMPNFPRRRGAMNLPRSSQTGTRTLSENPSPSIPPEPPSEFQNFVENSTGRKLPVFGSWLFERVPSTFAPLDNIPVPPDHTIGPGDQIDVRIWGQINADQRLVVDRTGAVFIPQVGRVNLSGLQFAQLEGAIRSSVGRVFRNFELSVNMGQLRSIQIFVMGHARRPGTYTVSSLSTLVNGLFVSGGPSQQGSMRNIQLKRAGQLVTNFDLYDLLLRGDKTKDAALQPGDVIFIPEAGPRIAVSGSVENSAIYEISANSTLRDVLAYAGGLSALASGQHAVLERIDGRASLESRNIKLDEAGLQTQIENGDIVKVRQIVQHFDKTVALRGNVADPVRLPWHEGMRISDLIPDKQALLTRNYWTEHDRLSMGSAGFHDEVKTSEGGKSLASATTAERTLIVRQFATKNDVQPPAADINWSYAAIERLDPQSLSTHVIPFHLGKVVVEHDEAADLALQPGDVITIFSSADFTTPQTEQTRYVRLEGEIRMAGVYSVQPGETLREVIARAGGLTEKAYLYGAEFTRESTRREQTKRFADYLDQTDRDLSQSAAGLSSHAISGDQEATMRASLESQRTALERLRKTPASGRIVLDIPPTSRSLDMVPDIPLENGDRFVVPPTPATVNVFGTVYNQASLLYKEDANIRGYLQEAGG